MCREIESTCKGSGWECTKIVRGSVCVEIEIGSV